MTIRSGADFLQSSPKNAAAAPELLLSEHAGCLLIGARNYPMEYRSCPCSWYVDICNYLLSPFTSQVKLWMRDLSVFGGTDVHAGAQMDVETEHVWIFLGMSSFPSWKGCLHRSEDLEKKIDRISRCFTACLEKQLQNSWKPPYAAQINLTAHEQPSEYPRHAGLTALHGKAAWGHDNSCNKMEETGGDGFACAHKGCGQG